jgi:hypothetical protein
LRFHSAQSCKTPDFCTVGGNSRFAGDFDLQKSVAKGHSFARTFDTVGISQKKTVKLLRFDLTGA